MRPHLALILGGILLSACAEPPASAVALAPLNLADARGGGAPFIALSVAAGQAHSCAVFVAGSGWCAGSDAAGQLGNGAGDTPTPLPGAIAADARFIQVDAASNHTCALTRSGDAYCWGVNHSGQLGNGTTLPSESPTLVSGGIRFVSISAGLNHSCALTDDGTAYCWGLRGNQGSQIGAPPTDICGISTPCAKQPVTVSTNLRFREIYAGLATSCGLATDDHIYCWGSNDWWNFGDGTTTPALTPRIAAPGLSFSTMNLGAITTCGIEISGPTFCWGSRGLSNGSLGNGTIGTSSVPVAVVGGHRFVALEISRANNIYTFACGITDEGDAYCWGHNAQGQLGSAVSTTLCSFQGPRPCTGTPTLVEGGLKFQSIAAGSSFTCATTNHSRFSWCWGSNFFNQLGTNETLLETCFFTTNTPSIPCSRSPVRMAGPDRHASLVEATHFARSAVVADESTQIIP